MLFPLHFRPKESYHDAPRSFGARRDHGTRKHAGCDLYAPVNTAIIAVEDGLILSAGPFYDGTWSIVVDHTEFVVRYGEVQANLPKGVAAGQKVSRGQIIAKVGRLKHITQSMLHFEMFGGDEDGALTDRSNKPYMRRSDLLDPTSYLDNALLWAGDFKTASNEVAYA
jgi:murein DD-endopeptidase MepM/ murein hydrolase activator NlpD